MIIQMSLFMNINQVNMFTDDYDEFIHPTYKVIYPGYTGL